ncbi:hypothetical protein Goshw_003653 [Gossypium schwendimanii]|uniref:Uncharacterized protein n=1 Tax=Gossypium schwendimanii TaxID=34291 RepID=A0A7J9L0V2_GOSSC|nr:hypothetical protein [Gossypium schwendimanii]
MSRKLSFSVNPVGKHETKANERTAANDGEKGGQHGVTADAGGRKTKLSNKRGGALIPVYTAGAVNSNRRHRQQTQHHSGSGSDTINRIASSRLEDMGSSALKRIILFFKVGEDILSKMVDLIRT